MYAIVRRYTPDVVEGQANECFADLTGLRTFFSMTYKELAEKIREDLQYEIGVAFTIQISTMNAYMDAKHYGRKGNSVSTYKEINNLFAGTLFGQTKNRRSVFGTRKKLSVPFIGKVK